MFHTSQSGSYHKSFSFEFAVGHVSRRKDLESTRFLASLRKLCVTLPTRPPVELVRVGTSCRTRPMTLI